MKSTGYFRHIDVGCLLISKTVRNKISLNEGDCFEIFSCGDMVIFKKIKKNEQSIEGQKVKKIIRNFENSKEFF